MMVITLLSTYMIQSDTAQIYFSEQAKQNITTTDQIRILAYDNSMKLISENYQYGPTFEYVSVSSYMPISYIQVQINRVPVDNNKTINLSNNTFKRCLIDWNKDRTFFYPHY